MFDDLGKFRINQGLKAGGFKLGSPAFHGINSASFWGEIFKETVMFGVDLMEVHFNDLGSFSSFFDRDLFVVHFILFYYNMAFLE